VNEVPQVQLGSDMNLCPRDSLILDAGNSGSTFLWQDGSTSQQFIVRGIGLYHVQATQNGCAGSDTVEIIAIHPEPQFNTISDTTICLGSSVVLGTQATGIYQYSWSPSTGLSSNTSASPTATVLQTIQYIVTAENPFGCRSKDSVVLTGKSVPVIQLGNDTLLCTGQSMQLNAGNPGAQFAWSNGVSTQTNLITLPGFYSVTVTANGCSSTDGINVAPKQPGVTSLIPALTELCPEDSVIIRASGGTAYSWFTQSGSLPQLDSAITAFPGLATDYFVVVTDPVCSIKDTLHASLTIHSSPVVSILKSNDISCSEPFASLTASGGMQYQWSTGGAEVSSANENPVVVNPVSDTWYHVLVADGNGCSNSDSILVNVNFEGESKYFIPNAFTPNRDGKNDCFGVKFWGPQQEFELQVFNRWGELVFRSDHPARCWDGTYRGREQPSGVFIYIIKAKGTCGSTLKKGTIALIR
jgi:gliding motility-associated-like protein